MKKKSLLGFKQTHCSDKNCEQRSICKIGFAINSVWAIQFASPAPVPRWQRRFQGTIEQIPSPLLAWVQRKSPPSALELHRDLPKLRSLVVPRCSDRIEEPRTRENSVRTGNRRYRQRTRSVIDFVRWRAENAITGCSNAFPTNLARRYHHQLEDRANFVRLPRRRQLRLLNLSQQSQLYRKTESHTHRELTLEKISSHRLPRTTCLHVIRLYRWLKYNV